MPNDGRKYNEHVTHIHTKTDCQYKVECQSEKLASARRLQIQQIKSKQAIFYQQKKYEKHTAIIIRTKNLVTKHYNDNDRNKNNIVNVNQNY